MTSVQIQKFGAGIKYDLEILHQCDKRVKTKCHKVLWTKSYVCRGYIGKSRRGDPSDILNRVKSTNKKMEKCKSTPKQLRYENHYAYDNQSTKTLETKVIITFLSLILTLVNFVFNSIG